MHTAFVLLEGSLPISGWIIFLTLILIEAYCLYKVFGPQQSSLNFDSIIDEILHGNDEEAEEDSQRSGQLAEPVAEESFVLSEPDEYFVDQGDAHLFYQKNHREFSVRVITSKDNKDNMTVITSLPIHFNKKMEKLFKIAVPQLVTINFNATEYPLELVLIKSAAVKWEDIQDNILRFIFTELDSAYSWKYEKQVVSIKHNPNPDCITIALKVETKPHLDLGRRLMALKGIVRDIMGDFPMMMDQRGVYDFHLIKAGSFTWDELLPRIKKIISEYFPAGVEFNYDSFQPPPYQESPSDRWMM